MKRAGILKYYAPIWEEKEIWDVWRWDAKYRNKITEDRINELIKVWGCIPRRIFDEYNKEPKVLEVVAQCNVHDYINLEGEELNEHYSGKVIHIYPKSNFTDKEYVPASDYMFETLFDKYKKTTKDSIVSIIKNFTRGSGASLSGRFFEVIAHDLLRKGGTFKVRNLTSNICGQLQLPGLKQNLFKSIDEITSKDHYNHYNIPQQKNFESVDAFVLQCNNGDNVHCLYQLTIAQKHNIKVIFCFH
jgi:hypothetical protein